jgi:hypothetical protein
VELNAWKASAVTLDADAIGKARFEAFMREIVTTFHLPFDCAMADFTMMSGKTIQVRADGPLGPSDYRKEPFKASDVRAAVESMPFPALRIVQTERYEVPLGKLGRGEIQILCVRREGSPNGFEWASRVSIQVVGKAPLVNYPMDKLDGPNGLPSIPGAFIDLFEALNNGRKRFVEQTISRQARRALGIETPTAAYREYIVVDRKDALAGALTRSEVFRRHPHLHAVRGHLRRYKNGKTAFVKPHTRGRGDALQVKDYVLP